MEKQELVVICLSDDDGDGVVFGHCSRNLSIGEDVAGIGLSGIDWYRLSIGACPRHRSTVKVNNGFSQKITWISGYNAIH